MVYLHWRRCGLSLWLGLLCAVSGLSAWAEGVRVEQLQIELSDGWRYAPAVETGADDVWALELAGSAGAVLQTLVLRQAPQLKADAPAFYENLTRKWASQYGQKVAIGWTEAEGVRWRTCRRPSAERSATVFQLTTVHQGRAYSLLAFTPADVETLPKPVYELLRKARFGSPPSTWLRARDYRLQPYGEALDDLVQPDAERLAQAGMLNGYGLEFSDAGFSWFLEGFQWRGTGRSHKDRLTVMMRGQLEMQAPASLDVPVTSRLSLVEGSVGTLTARLRLRDLCVQPQPMRTALSHLETGNPAPLDALMAASPCKTTGAETAWSIRAGEASRRVLNASLGDNPDVPPGLVHVRLLEATVKAGPGKDAMGAALLERLAMVSVYLPAGVKLEDWLPPR